MGEERERVSEENLERRKTQVEVEKKNVPVPELALEPAQRLVLAGLPGSGLHWQPVDVRGHRHGALIWVFFVGSSLLERERERGQRAERGFFLASARVVVVVEPGV